MVKPLGERGINLRDYIIEICPKCKNVSPYIPNPFYDHFCKNYGCGFKGSQSDLIKTVNDILLEEDFLKIKIDIKDLVDKGDYFLWSQIKSK